MLPDIVEEFHCLPLLRRSHSRVWKCPQRSTTPTMAIPVAAVPTPTAAMVLWIVAWAGWPWK